MKKIYTHTKEEILNFSKRIREAEFEQLTEQEINSVLDADVDNLSTKAANFLLVKMKNRITFEEGVADALAGLEPQWQVLDTETNEYTEGVVVTQEYVDGYTSIKNVNL